MSNFWGAFLGSLTGLWLFKGGGIEIIKKKFTNAKENIEQKIGEVKFIKPITFDQKYKAAQNIDELLEE